jgi:hypothetical protein
MMVDRPVGGEPGEEGDGEDAILTYAFHLSQYHRVSDTLLLT